MFEGVNNIERQDVPSKGDDARVMRVFNFNVCVICVYPPKCAWLVMNGTECFASRNRNR